MTEHFQHHEDRANLPVNIICLLAPLAGSVTLIFLPLLISTMLTVALNRSLGALLMATIYGGFILPFAIIVIERRKASASLKAQAALTNVLVECVVDIVALVFFVWWMRVNNLGL